MINFIDVIDVGKIMIKLIFLVHIYRFTIIQDKTFINVENDTYPHLI